MRNTEKYSNPLCTVTQTISPWPHARAYDNQFQSPTLTLGGFAGQAACFERVVINGAILSRNEEKHSHLETKEKAGGDKSLRH
jgi:hypothetical protein